jgi:hypothetical protein
MTYALWYYGRLSQQAWILWPPFIFPSATTTPAESHNRDSICTDPREIRPCRWLLSISTSGLTWHTTAPSSLSDPKAFPSPSPSLSRFQQTFIRATLADSRICLTLSEVCPDFRVRFGEYIRALCCCSVRYRADVPFVQSKILRRSSSYKRLMLYSHTFPWQHVLSQQHLVCSGFRNWIYHLRNR